ncbi:DNA recombination protein RmuC [endosymbiont of unidentified scaly snail isolate Monju]|uniref:DNA recombination protein RmuC n=1 Tax=endosymbiont of unidentified scaly snail isolate Monju TaxID=1248727 RepID=UPI000389208F|nr:DNA recombination protein RmuC [endosymbiont of unidentified scaly snail isolate Monju]BAN69628.1 DNA recombination protein RmuC [endosymbiont of unidentified scaly snail isolate Monju]
MERLLALFHQHPDDFLAAGLLLALGLLALGLWLGQRRAHRLQQRLDAALEAQQERLAQLQDTFSERLHHEAQVLLAGQQHGLQSTQSLLGERIGTVEKALLREQGALRLDLVERFEQQHKALREDTGGARLAQQRHLAELRERVEQALNAHREAFERLQREAITGQQKTLSDNLEAMSRQIRESFRASAEELGKRVETLTRTTDERLREISGQVEKRLADGFEKTTETFTRVLEHLSRIDEAQKKITELSGNVVSLQEVLTDKRSRGAFGEVQLEALVRNMLPEDSFELQATLSNGKRVDCLLHLPAPTGKVPIDAKFPLESYQRMQDFDAPPAERNAAAAQFRRDIQKHIRDIAEKYLIPGETADGAVMFIPAEAIFAEIHAHFPELVETAQRARVWMVSPTTLMAVLTTARAVLKDDATRKQIHIIQEHLHMLSKDFGRFQERMDKLAKHIELAHKDVEQVHTSARKISSRFQKIERVEIAPDEALELLDGPEGTED